MKMKSKIPFFQFPLHDHIQTGDFVQLVEDNGTTSIKKLDPDIELLWHEEGHRSSDAWLLSVATDSMGHIHMVGKFTHHLSLGSFSLLQSDDKSLGLFYAQISPEGKWINVFKIGSIKTPDLVDLLIKVSDENIFIVGGFNGILSLEKDLLDPSVSVSLEPDDRFYVLKLTRNGKIQYVTTGKGVNNENLDFDIDGDNNVYVTGVFTGSASFGGKSICNDTKSNECSTTNYSLFVSKINHSGVYEWVRHSIGSGAASSYAIAVSKNGNVYITGVYNGTVAFDPTSPPLVSPRRLLSVFLVRYNTHGNINWIFTSKFDPSWLNNMSLNTDAVNMVIGESLSLDKDENIYLTGIANGNILFGDNLIDASPQCVYIAKFDPQSDVKWIKLIEVTPPLQEHHGIHPRLTTESNGHSYLFGYFNYHVQVDHFNLSSSERDSSFFLEFDPEGKCQSGQVIEGLIQNHDHSIVTDHHGSVVVVGGFINLVQIGHNDDNDIEELLQIIGHSQKSPIVMKFGRQRPSLIGLVIEKTDCEGHVIFGPIWELPKLQSGKDYYLTPRGDLTLDKPLNWFLGTALDGRNLYIH